ncbi:Two-component response regulator SSK1p [Vanrija albida]|uniref:Two-component response regulator SSK1p n=1 Tax=Vanrija albida TaxID=181172 RepID=A0ABR3Q4U7_9TREE
MQTGFFDGVNALENQAPTPRSARTPLAELPPPLGLTPRGDALKIPMSTPLGDIETTPAAEYFSRATNGKSSGASGVVMQSPDGRPFGMYFEPPASGGGSGHHPETSRRKGSARRLSGETDGGTAATSPTSSPAPSRRASAVSNATDDSSGFEGGRSQPPQPRRKMLPAAPDAKPLFARGRGRSSTITKRQSGDGVTSPHNGKPLPDINEKKEVARNAKSDVVVPPINVLIVEDNPINQNILSMFFRKKKIKHQTAKDGVEAVEKWKTGGFHLILMDIQLPVMDGIEATKEIRKLERGQNIGVFPGTPVSDHAKSAIDAAPLSPFRSAVIIVALTASSLQTDRVAALAAGCNDFLTKPVSLKWLERKTIEWGCMQALIDFDGWRRWKGSDVRDPAETKMAFQIGPQANARAVASRLRIDRSKGRPSPPTVTPPASVPPAPSPPAATKAEANTGTSHQSSTEKPLPALPVE